MSGSGVMAVAALGIVVLIVSGLLVLWLLYFTIRRLLFSATHRAIDKVVDRAMDVGEKHLVSGVGTLTKTVGEQIRKSDPRRLEADVSALARKRKGRVGVADVMAELDLPQDMASKTLEGLARQGACRASTDETGTKLYLFSAFLERRAVLACDYCGGTFQDADADPDAPCPNCGAKLAHKSVVE